MLKNKYDIGDIVFYTIKNRPSCAKILSIEYDNILKTLVYVYYSTQTNNKQRLPINMLERKGQKASKTEIILYGLGLYE